MSINIGAARVGAGQKVAENQREAEAKKTLTVSWNKTSATIGETIGIKGISGIHIKNPSLVTVNILFNNAPYAAADSVTVSNNQITAHWKVKAYKAGNFTDGVYDAEIRYNSGVSGKTNVPLKIVAVTGKGDFFG